MEFRVVGPADAELRAPSQRPGRISELRPDGQEIDVSDIILRGLCPRG